MAKLRPLPADYKKPTRTCHIYTRADVIEFLNEYSTSKAEDVMNVKFSMFGDRTADEFHTKLNEMDPDDPYNWNVVLGYFKRVWN